MTTLSFLRPMLALAASVFFLTAGAPRPRPAHLVKKTKPCKTCVINGPTCVAPGNAGIFTLSGGTTAGWTVSCGTVIRSNSTMVTVVFPTSGCSLSDIETAGATCGGADIQVHIMAGCAVSDEKPRKTPKETPASPTGATH